MRKFEILRFVNFKFNAPFDSCREAAKFYHAMSAAF